MKFILNENLRRQLNADFGINFEVVTVRDMGWHGKKNVELPGLNTFNGFDFFIILDKNMLHQLYLDKFNLSIFILLVENNRRETLQKLFRKISVRIKKANGKA
jgi:hypothetical protein